jgi:DNA-binding CsgD family transcriptional regulator
MNIALASMPRILLNVSIMRRLPGSALERFSTALAELYAPAGANEFPARILASMQQLLSADSFAYNEFAPGHFVAMTKPIDFSPDLMAAFTAHIGEHPSLAYILRTGSDEPLMFSDFLSLREFRNTGIYREFFGELGIERQIGGVFNTTGLKVGYSFNRGGEAFNEEDRLLVRLFSSHLSRARRNSELWSAGTRDPGAGNGGSVVIGIDREGRQKEITEAGRRLICAYFPNTANNGLPETIARWMLSQRESLTRCGDAPVPVQPLCVESPHGRLTIHYSPADITGMQYLLLQEKPAPSAQRLRSLGLTSRESEVLYWVSQGKRNEEIAIIVGSAVRTVAKHVEHIFAKLGVETRAAAGAVAREVFG